MGAGLTNLHCIVRARQRYGLDLSRNDIWALAEQIKAGQSALIRRYGNAEHHAVTHNGVTLLAVFQPEWGRIVTFNPPETAHIDNWRAAKKRRR